MNKKVFITALTLSSLALITPSFVFAQTTTLKYPGLRREMRLNASDSAQTLTTIQQRGDQLIEERLTSLNKMLSRISSMTRLSSDQKTTLTNSINTAISGLTTLKAKIDADTDTATALADVKSIYTTYRVYAEFDPQTSMLATSDALGKSISKLTDLATKLQTRISSASAAGNDVTTLNLLLSDMQSKIADAKTQQSAIQSNVGSLTPSSYNTNPTGTKNTFSTARTLMQTARKDLQQALQDAIKIYQGLKSFKTISTGTPTPSLTPTPTV